LYICETAYCLLEAEEQPPHQYKQMNTKTNYNPHQQPTEITFPINMKDERINTTTTPIH